ncbi:MAG TPA: EAL domain-containing response regulator [Usitatibacter sp.]|nr:EAL domain-containing response regulator [Usitatibacter sp.]
METLDLRFLVVEDHGFQRWLVANQLEALGAQYVFSAGDGQEALDLIQDREPPIDVIVTDLDMPGMDGMEFIRRLAERKYPAALIVASAMDPSLLATVKAMAQAYGVKLLGTIPKPVTAKKLKEVIAGYGSPLGSGERPALLTFNLDELAAGIRANEFEAFFQPKVDAKTQATSGAEALVRWRHPKHGLIRPQAFIDAMEASGLIDSLTHIIVKAAARNCRIWREAGLDLTVGVNLSPRTMNDVGLADLLTEVVEGQGLEPRYVTLEVTESATATDVGRALENLARLRMKGFGLSIDDYGTGYSSMQRLTRIPFTELKIDQNFVKNAATQDVSRAVVESSLEMAKKLGISAVAEGVENRRDFDLVRSLGCDLVQGYYVSRPMEAGQFQNWVTARAQDCA